MNLDHLHLLIVPSSYVTESAWDLPHHPFPTAAFVLTWVLFGTDGAMTYLTREEYQLLEVNHPSWQQQAMENLRHSVAASENVFTHFKVSDDTRRVLFLACMHQDGIGSSRILLANELQEAFSGGYSVALPDRSCGLIVPQDVTAEELAGVQKLVNSMYEGATTPMSSEVYASADFTLPAAWTKLTNSAFSHAFLETVHALTAG